jgi:hypothetical protein
MTTAEPHAVLDELRSLAAEQGWAQVSEYVARAQTADRQILVAWAPGVRAEPLAAWIRDRDANVTVRTAELDALAAEPDWPLTADRIVIALHCGDLLMPATIAGAVTVMGRPGGSYAIVLAEAERIQSESDLATAQRVVAGALHGPEGAARRAGRGLLFWSENSRPGFLAERVGQDADQLARWLTVRSDQPDGLAMQRAVHALVLAAEAEAAAASSVAAPSAGQAEALMLPALRASVTGLHRRVLDHLDAQDGSLIRELSASLDTMRHDLQRELDPSAAGRDPRSAESLVSRRMSGWSEEAAQVITVRQAQSRQDAVGLLDVVDWALVNDVASDPGGSRYPDPIVQSLISVQPGVPRHRSGFGPLPSPPAPGTAWAPALRTAAVGGVVTAAALAALGVAVAPAVGAAAIGIAAAAVFGNWQNPATAQRRAHAMAMDAALRDELSRLMSVLSAELEAASAKLRAAVDAEFSGLESRMAAADEQARRRPADPMERDPAVSRRLARLRARIGTVAQADAAALPHDSARRRP